MIDQNPRAQDAPGDAALRAMFAARKQVFIDLLKWDLPALDGRFEIDQFDTPDARYLILLDPNDLRHRASARLLPTSAPHLLGEYYAHLCTEKAPSRSEERRVGKEWVSSVDMGGSRIIKKK